MLDRLLIFFLICVNLVFGHSRTFTFENYCSETVWFYVTPGATGPCSQGCIQGTSCDTINGVCYWDTPTPSNGNFRLEPNGGTNSITFPSYNNGQSIIWSGNIGGCMEGTCQSSPSVCDASGCTTLSGCPMTRAEFTLSKSSADFYDVEVISGFNLPLAIYPEVAGSLSDPYTCGSPGAPIPRTATGSCSWNFNPPSVYYNWVSAGGPPCSSNSNCASGLTCGLSNAQPFQLTCGELFGYWTPDQVSFSFRFLPN